MLNSGEGLWPGEAECVEFGWFVVRTEGGWVPSPPGPGAEPDLGRLYRDAVWDRQLKRFVKRQPEG